MGTPQFAVPSLQALVEADHAPTTVVTGPDRARGRGQKMRPTAVKKAALEHGIDDILQPESVRSTTFADALRERNPACFVVVAFKILPAEVLTIPTKGAFNLHGSLLPRYRGAAPIHRAVMNGDAETGVTTFFLEPAVDTGDIILKKRMSIGPNETTGDVHDRMMHLGAEAVVETVQQIATDTTTRTPQDDSQATAAPKVHAEEAAIPWEASAATVHNHIRGLSPIPGAWTLHNDTRLKVYRSTRSDHRCPDNAAPGTVVAANDAFVVACGQGCVALEVIQQPGRKRMEAEAFLNGYDIAAGAMLNSPTG